ncbi:MAG: cyclic nucleotide-binding domain-containing protein [Alphaproteobacteria bacterium]|nr:cyclic nucleotide-binding domain-containing protein [Alphaproteobacteria bacterium]
MSLQQETEMLRSIPMFSTMDAARLKLLSFTSERVSYMAGEEFIKQGEVGESAFVIMSGEVEVIIETGDGPLTVGTIGANQLVGEIALLHSGRRTASLRAKTPVSCLLLSKDVFFHLLREFPDFSIAVMRDLAARLERITAQLREVRR